VWTVNKRMCAWFAGGLVLSVVASFVAAVVHELRKSEQPEAGTSAPTDEQAQPLPVA
jgi:hypothetical protein